LSADRDREDRVEVERIQTGGPGKSRGLCGALKASRWMWFLHRKEHR